MYFRSLKLNVMIKKINKLVGLKKSEFDSYVDAGKISLSESRLIPVLKTGDEMALTSIIMSSLRLIKEFKDQIFKEAKLNNSSCFIAPHKVYKCPSMLSFCLA